MYYFNNNYPSNQGSSYSTLDPSYGQYRSVGPYQTTTSDQNYSYSPNSYYTGYSNCYNYYLAPTNSYGMNSNVSYSNPSYQSQSPTSLQNESIDFHASPTSSSKASNEGSLVIDDSLDISKSSKGSRVLYDNIKCEVCGGSATGFHYGAYSCQACKLFFTRFCKNSRRRRIEPCELQACQITQQNRAHCTICRFNKCISVGMSIVGRSRYGRVRTNVYTTDATSINVQLKGIFDETLGRFINIIKYKSDEQSNISSLNYIVHKFFSDSLTTIGVTSATDKQFNPSATVLLFAALFEVDIDSLFEQNILTSSHKKFQMHFFVPQMSLLKSFIDQSPITTQFKVVFFIYVLAELLNIMDSKIWDLFNSELVLIQNKVSDRVVKSEYGQPFVIVDDSAQKNLCKVTMCARELIYFLGMQI